eukprot:gene21810-21237_t
MAEPSARPTSDGDLTSRELNTRPRDRVVGHERELRDSVVMNTYLKAIARNGHLFKGKVCLDVGCGLGVRSMALVRAGATHVYAVEDSCIITQTRKIIAANNMEDKITLIDVSMKEVRLPGPVDVLVSMWMGEALLYKCSLADVLFARDRWLKADGIMFPSRASLYLVGIEMPMATEHEFWWSN